MTTLRATSVYTVTVPTGDLEDMKARCGRIYTASGDWDGPFLRFRAAGDVDAMEVAVLLAAGEPFSVRTGVGVNQREVQ